MNNFLVLAIKRTIEHDYGPNLNRGRLRYDFQYSHVARLWIPLKHVSNENTTHSIVF